MNICSAMTKNGREVELVIPRIRDLNDGATWDDIWQLYSMKPGFRIWELPTRISDLKRSRWNGWQQIQRFWGALWFALGRHSHLRNPETLVYIKCYVSAAVLLRLRGLGGWKARFVFEKPDFDEGSTWHRWICNESDAVVAGNAFIAGQIRRIYGVPAERLRFVSNVSQYQTLTENPPRARTELRMKPGKRHVTYSGKTFPGWLEVMYLLEAASILPDTEFIIIGGTPDAINKLESWCAERGIRNVTFLGFLPVPELFSYLIHSDLLVSYYDTKDPLSATQRNPGKMTLYACTGNPVIVADLPSMRELFDPDTVFYVPPDDPKALAVAVKTILSDPVEARRRGDKLRQIAEKQDYSVVYGEILRFIDSLPSRK